MLSGEDDYGVDVGLLLDASLQQARIAQEDIGHIEHDAQPLRDSTRRYLKLTLTEFPGWLSATNDTFTLLRPARLRGSSRFT